jgi:hypothetical protein
VARGHGQGSVGTKQVIAAIHRQAARICACEVCRPILALACVVALNAPTGRKTIARLTERMGILGDAVLNAPTGRKTIARGGNPWEGA